MIQQHLRIDLFKQQSGDSLRREITQVPAGRATDILVAEQVMGWQVETDETKLRRLDQYFARNAERKWWRKPEGGWYYDPPPYSSDIAAAWQVVEKMNSGGYALFLFQGHEGSKVAFDEPGATDPDYVTDKSMPGAICKAALIVINPAFNCVTPKTGEVMKYLHKGCGGELETTGKIDHAGVPLVACSKCQFRGVLVSEGQTRMEVEGQQVVIVDVQYTSGA